jgi:hypothetical protein
VPNLTPERLRSRHTLELSALQALTMHGNLLLALRHPANTGSSRPQAEEGVAMLGRLIVTAGVASGEELRQAFELEQAQQGMTWADYEAACARLDAPDAA